MIDLQTERQRKAFARVRDCARSMQLALTQGFEQMIGAIEDLERTFAIPAVAAVNAAPQLVDVDRAAEILDVNRSTIFGWVNAGELEFVALPSVKGDKPIRKFSVDQLESFKARYTQILPQVAS
jgi:hypothetical protein